MIIVLKLLKEPKEYVLLCENGTKYLEELGNPFDEIIFDPR
jgi:hypothetical protein